MNTISKEEKEKIEKLKERNNKFEIFLAKKRTDISNRVNDIVSVVERDHLTKLNYVQIIDAQAKSLSLKQEIHEQVAYFLAKRLKEEVELKMLRQEKLIFYTIGFSQLKVSTANDKKVLIDAHLSENDRYAQLLDTHIEFLNSSVKNIESFNFTVKNIIDLFEYLPS